MYEVKEMTIIFIVVWAHSGRRKVGGGYILDIACFNLSDHPSSCFINRFRSLVNEIKWYFSRKFIARERHKQR